MSRAITSKAPPRHKHNKAVISALLKMFPSSFLFIVRHSHKMATGYPYEPLALKRRRSEYYSLLRAISTINKALRRSSCRTILEIRLQSLSLLSFNVGGTVRTVHQSLLTVSTSMFLRALALQFVIYEGLPVRSYGSMHCACILIDTERDTAET